MVIRQVKGTLNLCQLLMPKLSCGRLLVHFSGSLHRLEWIQSCTPRKNQPRAFLLWCWCEVLQTGAFNYLYIWGTLWHFFRQARGSCNQAFCSHLWRVSNQHSCLPIQKCCVTVLVNSKRLLRVTKPRAWPIHWCTPCTSALCQPSCHPPSRSVIPPARASKLVTQMQELFSSPNTNRLQLTLTPNHAWQILVLCCSKCALSSPCGTASIS